MSLVDDRALMDRIGGNREQPHNLDLEQSVLGTILMNNDAYGRVADVIKPEHFFEDLHRRTWDVISKLVESGSRASLAAMKTYLGEKDIAPGVTMGAYLARLCAEAQVTIPDVVKDAREVRLLWARRQLAAAGKEMMNVAFDAPAGVTEEALFAELDAVVERIRPVSRDGGDFIDFRSASNEALLAVSSAYQRSGTLVGLSTGLPRLDDALGGLQNSDLIIIAGRPGAGKTALATNIAFAVAKAQQPRRAAGEKVGIVGFFSLEMSAAQLAMRICSDTSGVAFFKLRKGFANEIEMQRYIAADRELWDLPLHIDQTGGISIAALKARARTLMKRKGLSLLIVDYLQLLTGSGRKDANRVEVVTEITTGLKALAKELNVPIIALSQLSRRVEERPDRRPMLSDLRESGSIEQDADIVAFVYREEYYLSREEPRAGTEAHLEWQRRMHATAGVAQIIIGKNRHGPDGTVTLGFQAAYTRFIDEPEPREEMAAGPDRAPRAKKISLPKEATTAIGVLRSLTIAHAIDNTGTMPGVPRGVRPVDYLLWREKTAEQLLDPSFEEKDAVSLMKTKVVPALLEADMICRSMSDGQSFVWLTERGQG